MDSCHAELTEMMVTYLWTQMMSMNFVDRLREQMSAGARNPEVTIFTYTAAKLHVPASTIVEDPSTGTMRTAGAIAYSLEDHVSSLGLGPTLYGEVPIRQALSDKYQTMSILKSMVSPYFRIGKSIVTKGEIIQDAVSEVEVSLYVWGHVTPPSPPELKVEEVEEVDDDMPSLIPLWSSEEEPTLKPIGLDYFATLSAELAAARTAERVAEAALAEAALAEAEVEEPIGLDYFAAARTAEPVPAPVINYKNKLWPSPRPRLFAKALRLKASNHRTAVESLANYANISVETFLNTNPLVYVHKYMDTEPPMNNGTRFDLLYSMSSTERDMIPRLKGIY